METKINKPSCCRYVVCEEHFPFHAEFQEKAKSFPIKIKNENELKFMLWLKVGTEERKVRKVSEGLNKTTEKIIVLPPIAAALYAEIEYCREHNYWAYIDTIRSIFSSNYPEEYKNLGALVE